MMSSKSETQTDQRHVNEECDQSEQTGSDQQRGGEERDGEDEERDGEDEERDGEDEERDGEDEESDGEEETEDDEGEQTGRKKKTKRQRETNLTAVRAALLNVRSMNNKTTKIKTLITQNNLDVFLATETWLKQENAVSVLREASPPHFSFYYQVRGSKAGGGVAIQFLDELQSKQMYFDNITTFEYVAAVMKNEEWNQPVPLINVYYPPRYTKEQFKAFLREFQQLLDEVFKKTNSIIVTGDFNIWVDKQKRTFTDEFDFLLLHNGLDQHVREPTHKGGHTLDLVISKNVDIPPVSVRNDGISDHYTVYFHVRPKDMRDMKEKTKDNVDQDEQEKQSKQKEE